MNKAARTKERIAACALDLFERHGFEETTVAQIARAAGVTPMTVFRYFDTKARLVLDDPYDPVIADMVGMQPKGLPPIRRAIEGVRAAWVHVPEPESDTVRRRIRLSATTPAIRAGAWQNNAETERLVAERLIADGAEPLPAKAAASAVLAALITGVYAWAEQDKTPLDTFILESLEALDPCHD